MERETGYQVEDETLAELIADHVVESAAGGGVGGGDAPDPDANGYVSFRLPQQDSDNVVGIRVFPHHNDVGLRRVWEAGACLAEYLLSHPDLIRDKKVIELGAGVGLTGIVAAGLCQPMHVHMTDYTEACLDNMEHNISVNEDWLHRQGVNVDCDGRCRKLTSGYLEWTECAEFDSESIAMETPTSAPFKLPEAQVLLAADVVYDVCQIPDLVRCVKMLLSSSRDAKAIFATTFRNEKTFALFTNQLHNEGIVSQFVDKEVIAKLPVPSIFPCYFSQPRSDVRICILTTE
jgi:predicted nicotinamide N-methyase